ncbi:uncharacterized protein LOC142349522 isoform X2 [Convolutriloba macropyga]|uniref:uncharacterized protein LOC142349522 isoform X2 n=1 Tax=Convolutriloba macropyga TaxID=536237 RepID=UPI003F51AE63
MGEVIEEKKVKFEETDNETSATLVAHQPPSYVWDPSANHSHVIQQPTNVYDNAPKSGDEEKVHGPLKKVTKSRSGLIGFCLVVLCLTAIFICAMRNGWIGEDAKWRHKDTAYDKRGCRDENGHWRDFDHRTHRQDPPRDRGYMTNSVPNYDPVDVCVHSHDDHMITEWDQWDYNHDQMLGNRFAEIYTQSAVFNVYDIREPGKVPKCFIESRDSNFYTTNYGYTPSYSGGQVNPRQLGEAQFNELESFWAEWILLAQEEAVLAHMSTYFAYLDGSDDDGLSTSTTTRYRYDQYRTDSGWWTSSSTSSPRPYMLSRRQRSSSSTFSPFYFAVEFDFSAQVTEVRYRPTREYDLSYYSRNNIDAICAENAEVYSLERIQSPPGSVYCYQEYDMTFADPGFGDAYTTHRPYYYDRRKRRDANHDESYRPRDNAGNIARQFRDCQTNDNIFGLSGDAQLLQQSMQLSYGIQHHRILMCY